MRIDEKSSRFIYFQNDEQMLNISFMSYLNCAKLETKWVIDLSCLVDVDIQIFRFSYDSEKKMKAHWKKIVRFLQRTHEPLLVLR